MQNITFYALRCHVDSAVLSLAREQGPHKTISLNYEVHSIGASDEREQRTDIIELWLHACDGSLPLRELPLAEGVAKLQNCDDALPGSEKDPLYEHAYVYAIDLSEDNSTLLWLDSLNKDETRVLLKAIEPQEEEMHG